MYFTEICIKNYDENNSAGYKSEVDINHPEQLGMPNNESPFLPKYMKINKQWKLIYNLNEEGKYVVHIRNLKQNLNLGVTLVKVRRVI